MRKIIAESVFANSKITLEETGDFDYPHQLYINDGELPILIARDNDFADKLANAIKETASNPQTLRKIFISWQKNYSCLQELVKADEAIENQKSEIRKNSYLLAQAKRTGNNFFAQLPRELLAKIVLGTTDKKIMSEKEAAKIFHENFDRPNLAL